MVGIIIFTVEDVRGVREVACTVNMIIPTMMRDAMIASRVCI
jgi:hypothetical protein